jgi:hypothetical protein
MPALSCREGRVSTRMVSADQRHNGAFQCRSYIIPACLPACLPIPSPLPPTPASTSAHLGPESCSKQSTADGEIDQGPGAIYRIPRSAVTIVGVLIRGRPTNARRRRRHHRLMATCTYRRHLKIHGCATLGSRVLHSILPFTPASQLRTEPQSSEGPSHTSLSRSRRQLLHHDSLYPCRKPPACW